VFEDFKIGQEIRTVNCSDDLVLLAKEKTALKEMIYRINETGKFCGKGVGFEKLR
jgi:hypothetical protein